LWEADLAYCPLTIEGIDAVGMSCSMERFNVGYATNVMKHYANNQGVISICKNRDELSENLAEIRRLWNENPSKIPDEFW
jgi:hypothetical protein